MYDLLEQELSITVEKEFVLLDIAQPLIVLFKDGNNFYFTYVLQDRTVITQDNKKVKIEEVLVSKVQLTKVIDFLKCDYTLIDVIGNTETYRIGKIGNKIYPKITVSKFEDINDKIPKSDFILSSEIPNRINIKKVEMELMKFL